MNNGFVIFVQEYFLVESVKHYYGKPYIMRDERGAIMRFKDQQYAESLARELSNSPIRDYTVVLSR